MAVVASGHNPLIAASQRATIVTLPAGDDATDGRRQPHRADVAATMLTWQRAVTTGRGGAGGVYICPRQHLLYSSGIVDSGHPGPGPSSR